MSEFIVKYWKKGKPKGSRRFGVAANEITFENVLFDFTLNELCESNYYIEYWYPFLNNHLFVERVKANGPLCIYEVQLYDMYNYSNLIATYVVEIECLFDDKSSNLFVETEDNKKKSKNVQKEEVPSEWFKNESPAIRRFLSLLKHCNCNLKTLRKEMSKASYYRNLKVCEEKGYIIDGKLIKRTHIKRNKV